VAQQLCEAGFVLVNGRPAKSSHAVKVGDEISLRWRGRVLLARVLIVPEARNGSRQEAGGLSEVISDTPLIED